MHWYVLHTYVGRNHCKGKEPEYYPLFPSCFSEIIRTVIWLGNFLFCCRSEVLWRHLETHLQRKVVSRPARCTMSTMGFTTSSCTRGFKSINVCWCIPSRCCKLLSGTGRGNIAVLQHKFSWAAQRFWHDLLLYVHIIVIGLVHTHRKCITGLHRPVIFNIPSAVHKPCIAVILMD